jgi:ribA/ribD-fused uncharacterized protein
MITEFKDKYAFLSNFYIDENGFCIENHYQASKFLDNETKQKVLKMKPGEAKRFAHKEENQSKIRPDWSDVNLKLMSDFIRQKFYNIRLRQMLLDTEDERLIEGNYWHDNFYGSCKCKKCGFNGENHLGKLLMKERDIQKCLI